MNSFLHNGRYLFFFFFTVVGLQLHQTIMKTTDRDEIPVIDAHAHTDFTGLPEETSHILVTKDTFLDQQKEAGIVSSIVHLSPGGHGYDEQLAEQRKASFCFGVSEKVNLFEIEQSLQTTKTKCLKIYLGYIHKYASDPDYKKIYELAEKYDVPVVFHTGDTYSTQAKLKYAEPLTLDEIAVEYPKVNFIIAHMGNPWIKTAAEVAYKNPNVYIEGSALLIGNLQNLSERARNDYIREPLRWSLGYIEDPKKILFGTDWPLVSMKDYLEEFKKAIPREHWCDVFFNNAVRLFKLKEISHQYQCK